VLPIVVDAVVGQADHPQGQHGCSISPTPEERSSPKVILTG
jgi:hypothetical protein